MVERNGFIESLVVDAQKKLRDELFADYVKKYTNDKWGSLMKEALFDKRDIEPFLKFTFPIIRQRKLVQAEFDFVEKVKDEKTNSDPIADAISLYSSP